MDFQQSIIPGYRMPLCQIQTVEQTQDLRLPDSESDIGNVLGCWGQILIRGKEWHNDSISVSGGVMAWVLYAPEDGSKPVSMEAWIPFQMRWDMQDVRRDGSMIILPVLKSIDARNVSARKLVVRANISIMAQALEPVDNRICVPKQLPEDVHLNKQCYPLELPSEAGEMAFQMDEEFTMPENSLHVHKILYYQLKPSVTETRVLGDKLLFRGKIELHLLYMSEDGTVHTWENQAGFSKYTQLNKEHENMTSVQMIPIMTGSEMDPQQNRLQLKCSVAAQYVLFDRVPVEIVTDAYSPFRDISLEKGDLNLTKRLDSIQKDISLEQQSPIADKKILDIAWYYGYPAYRQIGDNVECELSGSFQLLCCDENGLLQSHTVRADTKFQIPSDNSNTVCLYPDYQEAPAYYPDGDGLRLTVNMRARCDTFNATGMDAVCGMDLGQIKDADPARPSLILRKSNGEGLWEIAKECGSSVNAIMEANQIQSEPESGRMLLIPVL